jgi:proteasome lid subunit RPN8/RPN11
MPVRVRIRKGQLDYFRKKAREASPNEIYALLIGKNTSKWEVVVERVYYPVLDESTPSYVKANGVSIQNAEEEANREGFKIVGSIHSHPNWPPIMSPHDHKSHIEEGDRVSGIVEVTNGRTRVAFWRHDTSLRLDLEYIDD